MRKPRRLPAEELQPYVWEMPGRVSKGQAGNHAEPAAPSIDWPALFGNDRPVEVEVGMGKGLFLLTAALDRSDTNFFGIEIVRKYQLYAAGRLAVRRLPNAKTACADAKVLLRDYIRPASVAAVHVYFPDPWWKTRHHKRRVFTSEFAAIVAGVLCPGGLLHIATDVEEYFQVMAALVRALPSFRERPAPAARVPTHDLDYLTNFERKAVKKGTPIRRARFERMERPEVKVADHQ